MRSLGPVPVIGLTHSHSERPKEAWQFWIHFSIKSIFWKIFEGEMLIISQTTTLLQIFCGLLLYSQVVFKSMKVADDTSKSNSECEWVKETLRELRCLEGKTHIEVPVQYFSVTDWIFYIAFMGTCHSLSISFWGFLAGLQSLMINAGNRKYNYLRPVSLYQFMDFNFCTLL